MSWMAAPRVRWLVVWALLLPWSLPPEVRRLAILVAAMPAAARPEATFEEIVAASSGSSTFSAVTNGNGDSQHDLFVEVIKK